MTSNSQTPQSAAGQVKKFTPNDLGDLCIAHWFIEDFETFLLSRFADYTRTEKAVNERGQVAAPVTDPFARTDGGYGRWRLRSGWLAQLAGDLETLDVDETWVVVEHYLADDRGGGGTSRMWKLPLRFVFGDEQEDAQRAEYLRLKAIYEPDATTDGPDDLASAAMDPAFPPADFPAEDAVEDKTAGLGFSLFDALGKNVFGADPHVESTEAARKFYERGRATLTLSGERLFGKHNDQVVSVLDDVADLMGIRRP